MIPILFPNLPRHRSAAKRLAQVLSGNGGVDGTRTRDPRRDRPVFYPAELPLRCWWVLRGSNPRPSPCKGDALPAELSTPWKRRGSLREVNRLGNWRAVPASDASKPARYIKKACLNFIKAIRPHPEDRRIAGRDMVTGHVLRVAEVCTDIPFWQHVSPLNTRSGVQRVGRRYQVIAGDPSE